MYFLFDTAQDGLELTETMQSVSGIAAFFSNPKSYFILAAGVFLLLLCLGAYVYHSLATFKLAKQRRLNYGFFAWLPILNGYLLGKICDDIGAAQGKKRAFRYVLLGVQSLMAVITVLFIVNFMHPFIKGDVTKYYLLAMAVLFIVALVCTYLVIYRIHSYYTEDACILYTMLSIIFWLAAPVLLYFSSRNAEIGTAGLDAGGRSRTA